MVYRNLVRVRDDAVNVWDMMDSGPRPDIERWVSAIAAGGCLVIGFRRRSPAGFCLSLAAGVLAWWAAGNREERRRWRVPWRALSPSRPDTRFEAPRASLHGSDRSAIIGRHPRGASTPPTDPLAPPEPRS
jgi:hypothetical protein